MSPVAAAPGIAIAGLILVGRPLWRAALPALFVAGALIYRVRGESLALATGWSLANVIEVGLSAFLLVRFCGPNIRFNRASEILVLVLCAGGVNAATAAAAVGLQPGGPFVASWLAWYSSHALGMLLVTPLILVWRHRPRMLRREVWESAAFMGLWLAGSLIAARVDRSVPELSIQPYMMALIAWPAIRMGRHVVTLALVILAGIILSGPHLIGIPVATAEASVHLLATQAFLLCVAGAGLSLCASQAQLRTAEARIRTIDDNLPNGVMFQLLREPRGQTRFLRFGDNSKSVFGIAAEDIREDARALFDCIVPEDRQVVAAIEEKSLRDLTPLFATPRLRTPDGRLRWMYVSATPRRLDDGSTLWEGIQLDITGAKEAELALRASEERYRLLIHNTELPVLVTDRATARFLFANESAAAFLRVPADELIGADAGHYWTDPSERERCVALVEQQGRVTGFETRMRVANGEERWVATSANRIEFDGHPAYFIVFSDITEIKRAQDELERERTLFRTLFSTIPDPAWLTDPNGVYSAGNLALDAYLPTDGTGVVGKTVDSFFSPETAERFRRYNQEAIRLGAPVVVREWVRLSHRNDPLFAEITRTPVLDRAGDLLGVLAIARDVTAQARAEQLLRERVALQEQIERIASSVPGSLFSFRMARDGACQLVYSSAALSAAVTPDGTVPPLPELFDLIHPEDRPLVESTMRVSAADLSPWNLDFRAHTPVRGDIWVEGRAIPLRESDGSTLWHGILINITDRKRFELELAEQSVRRRILIEQSSDGIVVLDSAHRVHECNASFAAMLGYAQSEMVGLYLWDFESVFLREQLEKTNACLAPAPIFETRYRRKDGSLLDVEVSVSTATVGGRALSYCVIRDVTRRKTAEEALRRSEERYRLLVESGTEGIWAVDALGITTFANPQLAQMVGYSSAELLGRDYLRFMDFPTPEALERWRQDARPDVPHRVSVNLRHQDGHVVPVLVSRRLLFDKDGMCSGGLMMITDLTEHKRMEQQLFEAQKARSIALLAGGVAHDFNNLLTPVLGLASVLHRRTTGRDREMVESIIQASETAANLTRQLLAYSGRGQMVARAIHVDRMVDGIRDLLRASLSRNVELACNLGGGNAATHADPGQIQQIIMNLTINAAEAIGSMHPGTVTITTSARSVGVNQFRDQLSGEFLNPGDYVGIEVSDTGCGMTEQVKARIFEPFFSTKFTGRGLGLAAVGGIIRSLHGGVAVATGDNAGSCFTVLLPACASVSEPVPAQVCSMEGGPPILVVDDDAKVVAFLTAMLDAQGYPVLSAASADAALAVLASSRRPAGVMLDLGISSAGGGNLLDALASGWPSLPVLLMSGLGEGDGVHAGPGDRRFPFVQKPFNYAALVETVRQVFGPVSRSATA